MITHTYKISIFIFSLFLIFGAGLGEGRIFFGIPIIQKVQAETFFERTINQEKDVAPIVTISALVSYLNELETRGGVVLVPSILNTAQWWGIVIYNETDTLVGQCVPVTSPLPAAIFKNLSFGNYVTEISLATTKKDCDGFNQDSYPLYLTTNEASFTIK